MRVLGWMRLAATACALVAAAPSEAQPGGTSERYRMRQKLVSFGDDHWIENQEGQRRFKVNGKLLRVRHTLDFEDLRGTVQAQLQERVLRVRESMAIESPGGEKLAEVKKAIVTPLRDRWTVKIGDGPDLAVQGNVLKHEYSIREGDRKAVEVSKEWFRVRDTYGVEVSTGQNDIVILAVTVAIDAMAHPEK